MATLINNSLVAALLGSLILAPSGSFAEDIYKIVDDEGNVTYSSEPPVQGQASEVIETPSSPPDEDIEAAQKRQQKIEDQFDKLDQARAEQARQEAQQRPNNTTTVIQSNTVLGGRNPWLYGPYRRGATVAPGAPTAPGYRPPHYRPPGNRPRPPVARPHPRTGP